MKANRLGFAGLGAESSGVRGLRAWAFQGFGILWLKSLGSSGCRVKGL